MHKSIWFMSSKTSEPISTLMSSTNIIRIFLPFLAMLHVGAAVALLSFFWRDFNELKCAEAEERGANDEIGKTNGRLVSPSSAAAPARTGRVVSYYRPF